MEQAKLELSVLKSPWKCSKACSCSPILSTRWAKIPSSRCPSPAEQTDRAGCAARRGADLQAVSAIVGQERSEV